MKRFLLFALAFLAVQSFAQDKYQELKLSPSKDDRACWEWGDYMIKLEGSSYYFNEATASLKDKATGRYIIPPVSKKVAGYYPKHCRNTPAGTILISMRKDTSAYSSWKDQGIFFFDSSKRNTPKEMDGLLFIKGSIYVPYSSIKGCYDKDYYGIFKIEDDTLKQLIDLSGPDVSMKYLEDYPGFGLTRMETCTTHTRTPAGVSENIHKYKVTDIYTYDCQLVKKDILRVFVSGDKTFLWILDKEGVGDLEEHFSEGRDYSGYGYSALSFDMKPLPQFAGHEFLGPREIKYKGGEKYVVIVDEGEYFGVIDLEGNDIIPPYYIDPVQVDYVLKDYAKVSYSIWYDKKAEFYRTNKGEFEKEEHFVTRFLDPELQDAYIKEKMGDAESDYLAEMLKKGVSITLGKYDSERECFPMYFSPAGWNGFNVPIPINEAPAFKDAFESMKADALAGARFKVCNDAIAISEITFTFPDGKSYTLNP